MLDNGIARKTTLGYGNTGKSELVAAVINTQSCSYKSVREKL